MKLWLKILIAMVLGVIVGSILGPDAKYLKPIGTMFLNAINMIIVLLVFSSMTLGITSIHDPKKLGRVGLRTLLLYLGTTIIATIIGISFGTFFQPGDGLGLQAVKAVDLSNAPDISSILLTVIPSNPVAALAQGNVIQIIVFSIFLGLAINFAGPKGKPLLAVIESLADVMYRLTSIVMAFSPIGVFALMAWVAGSFGVAVFLPLLKFVLTLYGASLVHVGVVFCGILWFMARLNPIPFFKGMKDAMVMAFSTCSSAATLPVAMHCVQENLGVSKNISGFVLPLGITINMNGTAIYQAMSAVFIAQVYGISLDITMLVTISLAATLSAIGTAGIPGSGFIMLSVVLASVGLPLEGLAIMIGVERLREMVATTMNILGDAVVTVYVAKKEGELDERKYYHTEIVEFKPEDA